MTVELIAEDGGQRQHRLRLRKLIQETKGPLRVASAYVTDDEMLYGITNRKVHLLTSIERMDIISGATKLKCLRSLIESRVQTKCLAGGPRFHAKVYIFGHQFAVVTSANLTTSGLDSNIEVGLQFTGESVKELISWFDTFWKSAKGLDLPTLSELEKETDALRRAYAALRRKAGAKPSLPNEASPSVRLPSKLRVLLKNAPGFFVCNTNRRNCPSGDDEDLMRYTHFAAAWTQFDHPSHMERVKPGAAIFMFAKGVGIIGVGRAKSKCEVLPPGDSARITSRYEDDEEWRVPVDRWYAWAEHEEDAFPWKMPNATFLDVNADKYLPLREGIRQRFLRGS